MPVYKFRVCWEDEDTIYRDIALIPGQTFAQFHEAILKAFEFDNKHQASFFESNDKWMRFREISSEVLTNKKDAPALAMVKTPVAALIDNPNKKFIYEYDRIKKWTFLIELIGIDKEESFKVSYPHCFRKEGLAPSQSGIKGIAVERMMEIEEKYDLGQEEMSEGFTEDTSGAEL